MLAGGGADDGGWLGLVCVCFCVGGAGVFWAGFSEVVTEVSDGVIGVDEGSSAVVVVLPLWTIA